MNRSETLKYISFALLAIVMMTLMTATVIEKIHGSSLIYTSPATIILWGLLAISGISYLISCRSWKQIMTFSLHLSFLLILGGALVTHYIGKQGKIHLRTDADALTDSFTREDGSLVKMPFKVGLEKFSLDYYDGTSAPMDYVSTLVIKDGDRMYEAVVSMNNIHRYRQHRFYQSGYDKDGKGSFIAVSYDPYGIGLTYSGYALLLISMIGFFFQNGSRFKALLTHPSLSKAAVTVMLLACPAISSIASTPAPKTVSRETADVFGDLYVYYNDRICPMQTVARDFTVKLYGKPSYKGLTAEQVLMGWFFYYDRWKSEPMIKIKGSDARSVLGIDGKYASLDDFVGNNGYKLDDALTSGGKNFRAADEKFNIISMVCTGSMFRIYPYSSSGDTPVWYSLADRLPSDMRYEEWAFVTGSMNYVAEKIAMRDNAGAVSLLEKIRDYQISRGETAIPSDIMIKAEKIYNDSHFSKPLAMSCLTIGMLVFMIFCLSGKRHKWLDILLTALCSVILAYQTLHLGLRWYISGHVPLSNGCETMQFMAWACLLTSLSIRKHFKMALPFGIICCGFALLVSMMGESNPQITRLMPVLQSPLLSIHVMVIMLSYTLFAFMMLNGVAGLICIAGKDIQKAEHLQVVSNIMLYPAVFLLTAGIFIGAVWANISWGRYWGWDPKEVWALITMLVYSLGFHQKSLKWFRSPRNFHIFTILAFLSVLITYFGVNFILGGLHSYA